MLWPAAGPGNVCTQSRQVANSAVDCWYLINIKERDCKYHQILNINDTVKKITEIRLKRDARSKTRAKRQRECLNYFKINLARYILGGFVVSHIQATATIFTHISHSKPIVEWINTRRLKTHLIALGGIHLVITKFPLGYFDKAPENGHCKVILHAQTYLYSNVKQIM